jgi:hypothetical protein
MKMKSEKKKEEKKKEKKEEKEKKRRRMMLASSKLLQASNFKCKFSFSSKRRLFVLSRRSR